MLGPRQLVGRFSSKLSFVAKSLEIPYDGVRYIITIDTESQRHVIEASIRK